MSNVVLSAIASAFTVIVSPVPLASMVVLAMPVVMLMPLLDALPVVTVSVPTRPVALMSPTSPVTT